MRGFRGQVGDERDERGRSRRGEGRDGKVVLPKEKMRGEGRRTKGIKRDGIRD